MYLIVIGNPVDGFQFIVNEKGFPFETFEEAKEVAERTKYDENWWIAEAIAACDYTN